MSRISLITVFVVTAILLGFVLFFGAKEEEKELIYDEFGRPFLNQLKANINRVGRVTVRQGANSTTLQKQEARWVVEQRENYPADFVKIKDLLISLSDLKTLEMKTRKEDKYELLGVDIPSNENSVRSLILEDEQGGLMSSLIVGNVKRMGQTSALYVRLKGDPQSWLVSGQLMFQTDAASWLDKNLVDFSESRWAKIELNSAVGDEIVFTKESSQAQEFVLQNIPKGKALKSKDELTTIANAFSQFALDDVVTDESLTPEGKKDLVRARFTAWDGLVATLVFYEKDNKAFAKLGFDYAQSDRKSDSSPKKGGAEKISDTGTVDVDSVKAEIKKLNDQLKGRVFELPLYKAKVFKKTMDDLLQE